MRKVSATLAFDVYGTLIDPLGVVRQLEPIAGNNTRAFAEMWRSKQIEYLFRRGLGRDYQPFSVCTRQALEYTALFFRTEISAAQKAKLLDDYRELPAYPEIPAALQQLGDAGYPCFAFSNGEPDDLNVLLAHAGIDRLLKGVISVHDVRSFKPDPAVYAHFLRATVTTAEDAWLVSGNPFDVIGAHVAGWRTAWVRRDTTAVFDPWDIEPTVIVSSVAELVDALD